MGSFLAGLRLAAGEPDTTTHTSFGGRVSDMLARRTLVATIGATLTLLASFPTMATSDLDDDGTFGVTPIHQITAALAGGSTQAEGWLDARTTAAVTFGDSLSSLPSPSRTPSSATESACGGRDVLRVAAGADLATVAAAHPAGTTFCLGEGTFVLTAKVVSQPGDAFIGAGREETFIRPSGVGSPVDGFVPPSWGSAGAAAITYRALDIGGFTQATTSTTCNNACGTAIWNKGDPLTGGVILRNVRCHDNGTSCVGHGLGSVVARNIECDGNGFHPDSLLGDFRSSACMKLSEGSLTLRNSHIHDNAYDAIWCDHCGQTAFIVTGNIIENNGRSGVHWEASGHFEAGDHAIIGNNVIKGNGVNCGPSGSETAAGVIVEDGQNILIEGNDFGGNSACESGGFRAVRMWDTPERDPANANIVIRDNRLHGDSIFRCSSTGVTCEGNA